MDFTNLVDNGNILFEYLRANGYSSGYIFRIKGAYNYIIRHCDNSWTSYDDVLHDYHIGRCESGKIGRKSAINVIRNFDVEGVFPSNKANSNVDVLKTSYDRLNPSFVALVDKFDTLNRNAGLSYNTIHDKHLILIFNQPIGNLDSYNFVIRRQPNLSGESLTAFGFLC